MNELKPSVPARGVLSHLNGYQGSYGYLVEESVDGEVLQKTINRIGKNRTLSIRWEVPANAKNCGGLAIFGNQLGCYPVQPTVLMTLKN